MVDTFPARTPSLLKEVSGSSGPKSVLCHVFRVCCKTVVTASLLH